MNLVNKLRQYFGHSEFRLGQETIITSILNGKDVVVVMPTGGGKSICFQLPALLIEGVTLVISPLISLMKDQVDSLNAKNIPATYINSSLTTTEQNHRINELIKGQYKLVYIAPERFRHLKFIEVLRQIKINFCAIDEAHCLSMWGHDFRPDYLRIGKVIEQIGKPVIAALTATATPEVRNDIKKYLNLSACETFVTGFARPNLDFKVSIINKISEKYGRLSSLANKYKTGIIYCSTRKKVTEVSARLTEWDISHITYHGGLNENERKKSQEKFLEKKVDIAVATNAFGMGIDRSDIRFVAHFQIPGSIEAYYQEAGRAGRDGESAQCELLFCYPDKQVQEFFISGSNPDINLIRTVFHKLKKLANSSHEIKLSINGLTEHIDGKTNTMAVATSLSLLNRYGYIERFDITGSRFRGTRLIKPHLHPSELQIDLIALKDKENSDRAKLDLIVKYAYTRSCRQKWILNYFGDDSIENCGHCDRCTKSKNISTTCNNVYDGTSHMIEDITLKKALSGIARMSRKNSIDKWEGRYGRNRIINMLIGSKSKSIIDTGLNQLSTYGILKNEGKNYVEQLFKELDSSDLIVTNHADEFPLLTLTDKGDLVMRGKKTVSLYLPVSFIKNNVAKEVINCNSDTPEVNINDDKLFEELRFLRKKISVENKIPAYLIFSDNTLKQLAREKPITIEEARKVSGIGPNKIRLYLPLFLKVIATYDLQKVP